MDAPSERGMAEMSIEELKALKWRWYVEAQQDGTLAACYRVGRVLGEEIPSRHAPKFGWSHEGIAIYVDDFGRFMEVRVGDRLVCSTHYGQKLFVPGPWVEVVREFAAAAVERERIAKEHRKASEKRLLLAQLGGG